MIVTRPDRAVPDTVLGLYEQMGWWAQCKMNGTYTQVTVENGVVTDARNRHDQPHKAWELTDKSRRTFEYFKCRPGKWVLVAELMHSKVPGIRDTHYFHDVIVADGRPLFGWTYRKRWETLGDVLGTKIVEETPMHWVIDDNTWLAKCWQPGADYRKIFASLKEPQHEGLVIKNPVGLLSTRDNSTWQVKCRRAFLDAEGRRPNKNLSF